MMWNGIMIMKILLYVQTSNTVATRFFLAILVWVYITHGWVGVVPQVSRDPCGNRSRSTTCQNRWSLFAGLVPHWLNNTVDASTVIQQPFEGIWPLPKLFHTWKWHKKRNRRWTELFPTIMFRFQVKLGEGGKKNLRLFYHLKRFDQMTCILDWEDRVFRTHLYQQMY